jgi:hypothetical protein
MTHFLFELLTLLEDHSPWGKKYKNTQSLDVTNASNVQVCVVY